MTNSGQGIRWLIVDTLFELELELETNELCHGLSL
jgi:hypothetical protein